MNISQKKFNSGSYSERRNCYYFLRCGFTLIELLTVIAILAILGAMLLPVSRSAIAKSRDSVCVNNLRQITMAVIMYHNEHGVFPDLDPRSTDDWQAQGNQLLLLSDYLGTGYEVFHCPSATENDVGTNWPWYCVEINGKREYTDYKINDDIVTSGMMLSSIPNISNLVIAWDQDWQLSPQIP